LPEFVLPESAEKGLPMRAARVLASGFLAIGLLAPPAGARPGGRAPSAGAAAAGNEYVVVYREGVSPGLARAAVHAAGGEVVREHPALGVAIVRSTAPGFAATAGAQDAVFGAAANTVIGHAPERVIGHAPERLIGHAPERVIGHAPENVIGMGKSPVGRVDLEREPPARGQAAAPSALERVAPAVGEGGEPLADRQWDMAMIEATAFGSHARQPGDPRVLVGIMDTGVDGSHPDIAPNFDRDRSRNFTTDIPAVDGPCEEEPDGSCQDPADVDEENGHGTHVAGVIGAASNGLGIAGVAPTVTLVNVRAGQDSGLFFLGATVDGLVYAADAGIDVLNMSFYVDPWLFNCAANPADSPEAQAEQRTVIEATQRALDYAHAAGVALIAAAGNENTDLGNPTVDVISPDYPPGAAYPRTIDNTCLTMPTEGANVVAITAVGPSGRKAYYSNFGLEQADVAAPGGDRRDLFGTDAYDTPGTRILSTYPEGVLRRGGLLDANGDPLPEAGGMVVKDCAQGVCAYYQYLQGTSMAAPHAAGVAALAVSEFGAEVSGRGLELAASKTVEHLLRSATDTACPDPAVLDYPDLPEAFTATCNGDAKRNGFYGEGLINALRIVDR
jgi:subtilisin family serine protease